MIVFAARTVDKQKNSSLIACLIFKTCDMEFPIIYDVDRIRDGGSFTTRRVVAIQKGEPIFNTSISFHKKESGPTHQIDMPDIPSPEECKSEIQIRKQIAERVPKKMRDFFLRERPIEI
jgi:acyl-CoA thioesterase-2